jgi:hypothetical protein
MGGNFPKRVHDLRDVCVSLRDKFQVAKIISDAQTVHSWYKYMRKFISKGSKKWRGGFLSFLFCKLFFFSNGVTDGWNLWENGQVFLKNNMEFQVA